MGTHVAIPPTMYVKVSSKVLFDNCIGWVKPDPQIVLVLLVLALLVVG